ncbi:MAG TPA: methyltransferase domain-containing protein [Anaerolineales bacterium]|nr:methyltransferase domain-containing protein [Anaerolineales bacterium]
MDQPTRTAREWLDRRYRRRADGSYLAHQPVGGWATSDAEPNIVPRLARTYRLLSVLEGLEFGECLDVGGGEGYLSALVRDLFGAEAWSSDLSTEACLRARELFGVRAYAADAARLPFADDSFDLVVCSEVIEHLPSPVVAIAELVRVARKHVIITTEEACPLGESERGLRLHLLGVDYPHAERNWFTPEDFRVLLGGQIRLCSQWRNPGGQTVPYFSGRALTQQEVEAALDLLTSTADIDGNHRGLIVRLDKGPGAPGGTFGFPTWSEGRRRQVIDRLLGGTKAKPAAGALTSEIISSLQCPRCGGELAAVESGFVCQICREAYPVRNGVPVFILDDASVDIGARESAAIARLANGDLRRGVKIQQLTKRLHARRPVPSSALSRLAARWLLRILLFVRRPESAAVKARRVLSRLRRTPPIDFDAFDRALAGADGRTSASSPIA